jgi:hypothetical protein
MTRTVSSGKKGVTFASSAVLYSSGQGPRPNVRGLAPRSDDGDQGVESEEIMRLTGTRSGLRAIILVVTIIGSIAVQGTRADAQAGGRGQAVGAVAPLFRALLPGLARTHVPPRLPTIFPEVGGKLYATLTTAKPGQYSISIDFSRDCHGADACHYGDLAGWRAQGSAKPVGSALPLGKHITGHFQLGKCGASCALSTITWAAGGFRYTVGAKVTRTDLITLAASAAAS